MLFMLCLAFFQTPGLGDGTWVDLTHNFNKDAVYWPTAQTFDLEIEFKGETDKHYHYEANRYAASEHGGTHLDSPIHFFEGRHTVDQIPIDRLVGEAAVIDVSAKAANNPDYQVGVADILAWEKEHNRKVDGLILLLSTGYAKFWPDRKKYMGTDERGEQAVPKLHFPGLDPDAATFLAKERRIKAVGLDTPSIDYGQSTYFKSHRILFEANIPAFENVAALDQLPAQGAVVFALPMKIEGGSGAPLRIIAFIPKK